MRLALFTDTLADINGVSRFIRNMAEQALETGRDLRVITSTRMKCPDLPNIHNFPPLAGARIPRYENLEVVLPPARRMARFLAACRPDAVHISTPGPVGLVGRFAARRRGLPMLGVYHTDFPAYIDHLFDDPALTWASRRAMGAFYRGFDRIFTRSREYMESLTGLGIAGGILAPLTPGVDTRLFHPRFRDLGLWARLAPGSGAGRLRILSVGRVSVEKNLPFLAAVWPRAHERLVAAGVEAELVIVGDGPYRAELERRLAGRSARFLGFRHGGELSAIYASCDLFVFPSTTDTLGQVAMESQASGLPVLVSDRGGPKEVVRDGRTGHILSAADPGAWVEAIVRLATDRTGRERMGAAAHGAMQAHLIRRSFEHFWAAHEEIARGRGAPGG